MCEERSAWSEDFHMAELVKISELPPATFCEADLEDEGKVL